MNLSRAREFQKDVAAGALMVLSWLYLFPHVLSGGKRVFLGMDITVIFYPVFHWAGELWKQGHLPLISDLALHGAPLAAMSPLGLFSPAVILPYLLFTPETAVNLLSALPVLLLLLGTYIAVRTLDLSRSAALLAAFLWAYNGTEMTHLDRYLTWVHAFFPWVFWALLKREKGGGPLWVWSAGFLWGLGLLSGHLQAALFQGVFLFFWVLLSRGDRSRLKRLGDLAVAVAGALLTAAPRFLHTAECLFFDPAKGFAWGEVDKFYHSWTPMNAITLFFPWFFGKYRYDYVNDFWWQYHFTETQAALSVTALFFFLIFFLKPHPRRAALGAAALFGVAMALGRFSPLYRLLIEVPPFSIFRDPARWWFLTSWALGLAAAYGWDTLFTRGVGNRERKWLVGLAAVPFGVVGIVHLLLGPAQGWFTSCCGWMIRRFLVGQPLHSSSADVYIARLPEKWSHLSHSVDVTRPEVFLPLVFTLVALGLVAWGKRLPDTARKSFLLILVFADLAFFRMPYGNSVLPASALARPAFPPPKSRMISLLPANRGPYDPKILGEMAAPDTGLIAGYPGLNHHLGRFVPRYSELESRLGWFAWVYPDRDPEGWARHPHLLSALGIDLVAADIPAKNPGILEPDSDRYPYLYRLSPVRPQACLVSQSLRSPWPEMLDKMEQPDWDPLSSSFTDRVAGLEASKGVKLTNLSVVSWTSHRARVQTDSAVPALLVLQKTFLPGWKVRLDGRKTETFRCDGVLLGAVIPAGPHRVDLSFDPTGLRLGLFASLLFLALGSSLAARITQRKMNP